jgi:hypothetical protein
MVDLAAFALVIADALGDGTAVPGGDLRELVIGQPGLPGGAGGGGLRVRRDEQVGHGPCPDLPFGVEGVQIPQVTQVVGAVPGVQRGGEMVIAGMAVADDDPAVAV